MVWCRHRGAEVGVPFEWRGIGGIGEDQLLGVLVEPLGPVVALVGEVPVHRA